MCESCGEFQLLLLRGEREYEAALQGERGGASSVFIANCFSLGFPRQIRLGAPAFAVQDRPHRVPAVPQYLAPETVHVRLQGGEEPGAVLPGGSVHHQDCSDQAEGPPGVPEVSPAQPG